MAVNLSDDNAVILALRIHRTRMLPQASNPFRFCFIIPHIVLVMLLRLCLGEPTCFEHCCCAVLTDCREVRSDMLSCVEYRWFKHMPLEARQIDLLTDS